MKKLIRLLTFTVSIMLISTTSLKAAIIYNNDFEANTNGFNTSGRGVLPNDTSGGTSTWLGGNRTLNNGSTILTLTGLTIGSTYNLAFDLYIGGSWDGSRVSNGPDFFSLTSSSTGLLVNATFVNDVPIGAGIVKQTYSDGTPLGDGGEFLGRTGADLVLVEPIYFFSHGVGNPLLSFTANSSIETLTFASSDAQNLADEIFALDNVTVGTVPVPPAILLFGSAIIGILGLKRKN